MIEELKRLIVDLKHQLGQHDNYNTPPSQQLTRSFSVMVSKCSSSCTCQHGLIAHSFARYRHIDIFIGAGTLMTRMDSSESSEDESESGLVKEEHRYLRRR